MRRAARQHREIISVRLPDGRDTPLLRVADPRARRMRLRVSERGARLTVPSITSDAEERQFLEQHLHWLSEQLRGDPDSLIQDLGLRLGQTSRLPLRGMQLEVEWRETRWLHVSQEDGQLIIGSPQDSSVDQVRQALRDFYLAEARADVGRWLPRYLPDLPRPPRLWRIRPLSSLWGSLSSSDVMSLDLALVLAPTAAFEYVLVHELCHLIQGNHSSAFWQEVEQRFPHWQVQRRWLRQEGRSVKRDLHCLLS